MDSLHSQMTPYISPERARCEGVFCDKFPRNLTCVKMGPYCSIVLPYVYAWHTLSG